MSRPEIRPDRVRTRPAVGAAANGAGARAPRLVTVPTETTRPGLRRAHPRLHDATVAVASVGVLGLLVLYAIAAPSVSLTASAGSVVPLPGPTAVVVGRVLTSGGGGLKGARIDVRRSGREAGTGLSNAAGAFRVELPGRCAVYSVSIRARAQGSTVAATVRRRLCPGDALPVDARVVTQGQFLWVPGPR